MDLLNIQSQIEKLQKQASEIKAKEFAKTVVQIRELMQAFGITVKDLHLSKPAGKRKAGATKLGRPAKKSKAKKTIKPAAAKFRGPAGQLWSGRGLTPRWLTELKALGRTKEEFAIPA